MKAPELKIRVRDDYEGRYLKYAGETPIKWVMAADETTFFLKFRVGGPWCLFDINDLEITDGTIKWWRVKPFEELNITKDDDWIKSMQYYCGKMPVEVRDDPSRTVKMLEFEEGANYRFELKWLEEVTVDHLPIKIETKTIKGPAWRLLKAVEEGGYKLQKATETWKHHSESVCFLPQMLRYAGEDPKANHYSWRDEWLGIKTEWKMPTVLDPEQLSYKEWIHQFMLCKRDFASPDYLVADDLKDLRQLMSFEEVVDVQSNLRDALEETADSKILSFYRRMFVSTCCPFCVLYHDACDRCTYGDRHGKCSRTDSDYSRVLMKASEKSPEKVEIFKKKLEKLAATEITY